MWETDRLYKQGNEFIAQGLALFDREWVNVQAGQQWAASIVGADHVSARANTLVRPDANDAAQLCSAYPDAGAYVLDLRLHPRDQIHWLQDALNAARQLNNRAAEGVHLGNLGGAYADLGETRKAIEYHEQSLVIKREIGDRRGEGNSLGNLRGAYADLGETRKAIEFTSRHWSSIARSAIDAARVKTWATSASPTPTSARRARRLSSMSRG